MTVSVVGEVDIVRKWITVLLIPVIMVLSVLLLLKVSDLQLSARLFKGQCEYFNSKGVEENDIFHGSLFVVSTIFDTL